MAKKEELNAKEAEIQKKAVENVWEYFTLSKMLFGMGDESPYDINELKPDSQFYEAAKNLADELEIDWKKMSHEDSNRIMLSLLDDFFNKINVDGTYSFKLQINIEKKQ